ncbi:MFS transporter [Luteimonas sp. RIT-PG2_3]
MTRSPAHDHAVVPFARLSSFYLCYYAALGAFTPYWSLYLQSRGLEVGAISILMSLWYATRIVAPSTWTTLASRSATPIRWLQGGCLLALLSFSAFLLPLEFVGLFVAMTAFCFFYNAVMPQFESITLSHLAARAERYGTIRVWGSVGFIVVVVVYGKLIDRLGAGMLPWLMLPLFVAMLGSALCNQYARPPVGGVDASAPSFSATMRRPPVIAFLVAAFLMQVSFGPYYTFFAIYLNEHGYPPSIQGWLWAIGVGVEVGVLFLSARIFRRFDARAVLTLAILSAALRWWVTALFVDNLAILMLAQATHALSFGAFFAAGMQLLARFFPGPMNGHGQGVFYGLASGCGGVLGALLAGLAWQSSGRVAFAISGFIALAGAFIAWRWLLRAPQDARIARSLP